MNPFWTRTRVSTSLRTDHQPSCREVARVVQAYLDGECDAPTALQVRAHLDRCPPCAVEVEVIEQIKQALAQGRCCGADPEVVDRLRSYVRRLSAPDDGSQGER